MKTMFLSFEDKDHRFLKNLKLKYKKQLKAKRIYGWREFFLELAKKGDIR